MPFTDAKGVIEGEKLKSMYGIEIKVMKEEVNSFITGIKEMDDIIGELIRGINTFYGGFGTGKSSLCQVYAINAVKCGLDVIYIDLEDKITKVRLEQLRNAYGVEEGKLDEKLHLIRLRDLDELIKKVKEDLIKEKFFNNSLLILDGFSSLYMREFRKVSNKFDLSDKKNDFFFDLITLCTTHNIVCIVTIKLKSELTLFKEVEQRKGIKQKPKEGKEGEEKVVLKEDMEMSLLSDIMSFKHGQDMAYDSICILRFVKQKSNRFFIIEKHPFKEEYCDSRKKYNYKITDGGIEIKQ